VGPGQDTIRLPVGQPLRLPGGLPVRPLIVPLLAARRTVTSKFNELVYQYPIRIPERYSLVIRYARRRAPRL
jgi:hypothetical protein